MDTRELFTEEEWRLLTFAPLWVFCAVASADAAIDEEEMAALAREVAEAEEYAEPLVRDVFRDLRSDDAVLRAYREDERETDQGLAEVADLLARKAPAASADAFKQALLYVGRRVAQATGGQPLLPRPVSTGEELNLFRIADLLGVQVE